MHQFGIRYVNGHHGMRKNKTVVTNHDGSIDFFGDAVRLNDGVNYLLIVAAVNLQPAGITLGDGVLLVVKYRPGSADAAVYATHDDGEPRSSRPVQLFMHVQQTVGAGGSESPCSYGGGGNTNG
ncbi:MAG: hypothetical protein A4E71_02911 [Smithella sp. PtaU1.Bin162]|nr:MAG: hypothetical protein A4E71_02911 [Smithella sp. PtaU1.Bin162]